MVKLVLFPLLLPISLQGVIQGGGSAAELHAVKVINIYQLHYLACKDWFKYDTSSYNIDAQITPRITNSAHRFFLLQPRYSNTNALMVAIPVIKTLTCCCVQLQ